MSATPIMLPAPYEDCAQTLSRLPLFRDLSEPILKSICEHSDIRRYSAGQTVYSLGQYDGEEFFVVMEGRMRVSITHPDTGAMLIEEIGPNSIFAAELAFSEIKNDAVHRISVTAEEELCLIAIDVEEFRALAMQRPSLMRNIVIMVADELAMRRYQHVTPETPPEQRVFAALMKFVERDGVTGEWRVQRMPKHRELADDAGVDESVTASAVATLIQEGVARRDYPGLVIEDIARLNKLAG